MHAALVFKKTAPCKPVEHTARLVSNYAAEYSAVTGGTVMEIKLSPSILSADFANLARDIKIATDAGAEYVHVDVMDGHFVPNITIGAPVVKALRKATDKVLDVHLMISDPDQYLDDFIKPARISSPYTTSPTVIRSSS